MIRRIIARVLVFVAVACGTAFFINKINNLKLDDATREMDDPKLPVVYCEFEGQIVNQMFGYTQVMATGLMRDGVVPVDDSGSVALLVDDTQGYGCSYSYELRTIAGDSLVEDGEPVGGSQYQGYDVYSVTFRMDMKENQEYVLVFKISTEDGTCARYYTRVVKLTTQYAARIISYASRFHDTTFVKDVNDNDGNIVYDALTTTADDNNLSHVSLTSSYDMVSWGGINPLVVTGIIPEITEIDNEYAVIHMGYVVESLNDSEEHYYNVDEYYTAVYNTSTDEIELLAFDRYMESMFDAGYISKEDNAISLGVADIGAVEYMVSSDNRKLTFAKQGELWYYDYDSLSLINIFSFVQGNYSDMRAMNTNVDVNILDMDDEGNIYFVVYGYMSRGIHEGENGISLYYFTADDFRIQEKFFVGCDEPYDVMKQETGRFTYYDSTGFLYYLLDGSIYEVNLNDMTQNTLVYGLPSDKYLISENHKIVAYPDSADEEENESLVIHNFETGEVYIETGGADDRLKALGFVNNDLIYGVADVSDILISGDNEVIFPMYSLYIISADGEQIKKYDKDNIYIMNAGVEEDNIYLERAVRQNQFYESCDADFIAYKQEEQTDSMLLKYNSTVMEADRLDIVFPGNIYISENVKYTITKTKREDDYVKLQVKTTVDSDAFYVFDNSGYKGEYKSAGRAILAVEAENAGLVVDGDGNTIYRSIAAVRYNTVADYITEYPCDTIEDSLMTCAYMCIEYGTGNVEYSEIMACNDWKTAFSEYTLGVGINISGIDLDTALYFLDRDVPFAACIDDGRYVLVISYNSTHIRYYDPILDEEVKVTRADFKNSLSAQENVMYTYTSQ